MRPQSLDSALIASLRYARHPGRGGGVYVGRGVSRRHSVFVKRSGAVPTPGVMVVQSVETRVANEGDQSTPKHINL